MKRVVAVGGALALLALAGCSDDDDVNRDNPNNPYRPPGDGAAPVANVDHWHAAYGFYVCGEFEPALPEFEVPGGIHTHGDGVIHIHPFSDERAGENATLANFLADAGVSLTGDGLRVGGQEWIEGETSCDGEDAELVVARWPDAQCESDGRETVTDGFDAFRFEQDGEGYTIAFVPEGVDVPPPPTAANLAELGALDQAPGPGVGESPCG